MYNSSRVRFRLFVAWNVYTVVFLLIFVFWLFLLCWCLCCLHCIWCLWLVFFRAFLCSLLVVVSKLLWILASPLPSSFLETYCLFISSLVCKALCVVVSFFFLWYFCWSSSLVHFNTYYLLIRIFHISVSWWSFTCDWLTANLLKSPGLFSVFWPFSIILFFGWSPLGRPLINIPDPLIIF